MGKTFRNAPSGYDEWGKDKRSIRKIDKKHQKIKVQDGTCRNGLDDDFISNGKNIVETGDWDYRTPKAKKIAKRAKSKFERKHGEIPDED